jgi:hypothetical protein
VSELKEIFQQLADKGEQVYSLICKVKTVHADKNTCDVTPVNGAADLLDVRLNAYGTSTGYIVYPTADSFVMVTFFKKNEAYVSLVSDIDSLAVNIEDKTFYIDSEGILLNGDEFGGLTKTPELKTQLDKTHALLTQIINIINGAPIAEPGNGAPSALQASLKIAITGKQLGSFTNIENTIVKHG